MDKTRRIPHEGARNPDAEGGDGLRVTDAPEDTEGHARQPDDGFAHGPGTGGDLTPRSPRTGGEFIDENDVEGHVRLSEDDFTHGPGTGGDLTPRSPRTGGEFIDENDVEGHVR